MRSLCKVLSYVDDEAEARGEPELAVLVVRQSDGLPGQGWWVGGAKKHGFTGLWEGPKAKRLILKLQKQAFDYWKGRRSRRALSRTAWTAGRAKTFKVAEDDDGIRLDRWFKRHAPDISFNIVSLWARTGAELDGKRATPGDRIEVGQTIHFPRPIEREPVSTPERKREPLTPRTRSCVREMVIYQDRHAFVLNKPPGLATQGGTKTHHHLDRLLDGLADDDAGPAEAGPPARQGHVGRAADRQDCAGRGPFLEGFLRPDRPQKVYWALVVGVPSSRRRPDRRCRSPSSPARAARRCMSSEEHGLPARTKWRVIDRAGNRAAWVELQPLTGRTHQLRAHMAAIGHPIVGDAQIWRARSIPDRGYQPQAPPSRAPDPHRFAGGGVIDVTAELPPHIAESLATIGFELMHGENMPLDTPKPSQSFEAKKRRESTAARDRRRGRRGERRSRSQAPKKR